MENNNKLEKALEAVARLRAMREDEWLRETKKWNAYAGCEDVLRENNHTEDADYMHHFCMHGFRREEWDSDCL